MVISINLFMPQEDEPVIWRGPLLANVVKQFWKDVAWGKLERLVYRGEATAEDTWDTSLPTVEGSFNFPLKYGYSNVEEVLACGKEAVKLKPGDKVFVLAPHQSHYVIRQEWANPCTATLIRRRWKFQEKK